MLLPVGYDGTKNSETPVSLESSDVLIHIWRADIQIMHEGLSVYRGKRPTSHQIDIHFKTPVEDVGKFNGTLTSVLDFLSFVRGSRVGVSALRGEDSFQSKRFITLGATISDPVGYESSWFDFALTSQLPGIFKLYTAYTTDESDRKFFRRALSYFCLGNSLRAVALEPALVMSMTALEVISKRVLGASKFDKLKKQQGGMSNVLREAFSVLQVHEKPEANATQLEKLIKDFNCKDAFEALVKSRNGVTHSFYDFGKPPPLHDALSISQWLVEIALLKMLGFAGKYADRRSPRWIGEHKSLP